MASDHYPKKGGSTDLDLFLQQAERLPQRTEGQSSGRLVFALDATASRQPTWDRASQLQSRMFLATEGLGGLDLQLCYYRGFDDFYTSPWVSSGRQLLDIMGQVQCIGGYTQIGRTLDHLLAAHRQQSVQAAVIIGDAVEESVDTLCGKAGKLGMLGMPLFMFQEGHDPAVRQCFQQMALVSNGAYAAFDESSAEHLAQLLAAVATFASGGYEALERLQSAGARHLLQQLKPQ